MAHHNSGCGFYFVVQTVEHLTVNQVVGGSIPPEVANSLLWQKGYAPLL